MIRRKDLQKIVAHYGNIAQVIVLIEEMSELTKAITKAMRGKENKADIAEEIADVQIMPTHKAIEYAGQRLAESGRKGDRVLVMVDGKIKAVIRKKKRKGA